MFALIDADILVYRVGFTVNELSEGIACARMLDSVQKILGNLLSSGGEEVTGYQLFLTSQDKDNFRYGIYPEYKTRPAPRPVHYNALRTYLIRNHGATVVSGEEADDRIGIEATNRFPSAIIVSIDKDLKQIPGHHWNFVKEEYTYVTQEMGLKWFYEQLLQGDTTDSIPGIDGIGKKYAKDVIAPLQTEQDMYLACCAMYREAYPDQDWHSILVRNGQLLKIRTKENEIWQPPTLEEGKSLTEALLNRTVPSSLKAIILRHATKKKNSSTISPPANTNTK